MVREHKIIIDFKDYGIDFIKRLASLYQSMDVAEEYKLSDKELHFFSAVVLLVNKGFDLTGSAFSNEIVRLIPGISKENRGVYIYKRKLVDKKWIMVKGKSIILPPVFRYKDSVKFNITLSVNEGS